jgi:hypothetical protein
LIDLLDSHAARRHWGRVPGLRVVIAYGIWLAKYGGRRG